MRRVSPWQQVGERAENAQGTAVKYHRRRAESELNASRFEGIGFSFRCLCAAQPCEYSRTADRELRSCRRAGRHVGRVGRFEQRAFASVTCSSGASCRSSAVARPARTSVGRAASAALRSRRGARSGSESSCTRSSQRAHHCGPRPARAAHATRAAAPTGLMIEQCSPRRAPPARSSATSRSRADGTRGRSHADGEQRGGRRASGTAFANRSAGTPRARAGARLVRGQRGMEARAHALVRHRVLGRARIVGAEIAPEPRDGLRPRAAVGATASAPRGGASSSAVATL